MKRRDFVKTSLCLGCAGALGLYIGNNYEKLSKMDDDELRKTLTKNSFLYKSENELPKDIGLDLCTLCQLNCTKCWMRENEKFLKTLNSYGYTTFENFKNFVDRHPFIRRIETSNNGELFLNPDLDKILKYAYEKNIELTAYDGVNLNTISEETAENLVKYKFGNMTVSIDGATPETYAIYRRGGDFNTVISNIKMINKFKEKYNSMFPIMTYKMIMFRHNEHEIEAVKKLAKELKMDYAYAENIYYKSYAPLTNPKLTKMKIKKYCNDGWRDNCCLTLFKRPQIDWNGDFMGCRYFYKTKEHPNSFNMNVFELGLMEVLNNERVLRAKLMVSDFNAPDYKDIPCGFCNIYEYRKKNNKNLIFQI